MHILIVFVATFCNQGIPIRRLSYIRHSDMVDTRLICVRCRSFFTKHSSRWSSIYLRTEYPILCYYSLNKEHVRHGKRKIWCKLKIGLYGWKLETGQRVTKNKPQTHYSAATPPKSAKLHANNVNIYNFKKFPVNCSGWGAGGASGWGG